jgi:hypothetical protein
LEILKMAKDESGVPGLNSGPIAEPYQEPAVKSDVSFIRGRGTPSPKSIEGKIERAGGQQKKAVE